MKKRILVILIVLMCLNSFGQVNFPEDLIRQTTQNYNNQEYKFTDSEPDINDLQLNNIGESVLRQNNLLNNLNVDYNNSKSSDTLFIGLTPGDSLYITGDYNYDGTIFVLNGGKLVFEDANGVINGDLIVWGNDSKLWIINSTIHFPQMYIYQRAMLSVANAEMFVNNSTFDYNGLPHDLVISQNASVYWENVTNVGFTTCGLSVGAYLEINGTNQAGEFIMTDDVDASFTDANTVLVWHHIPEAAVFDFSFPDGSAVENFIFNGFEEGVTEVNYTYDINNCNEVMWGLMPEANSDVTITDSQIRTVGVWFNNLPAYEVSGLVNNSQYSDFIAPLSNHNIHFINSYVNTWSLYMFHGSEGNVSNCILGEIGTMGNSECTIQNSLIDGSGGYLFATDTSVVMSAFSYLNCNFQTSGNAFGIMAYGAQNMGKCIAFEKSVMIIVQANLIQQPIYYDDAMMWYLYLDGPDNGNTESEIPIIGSAWIEKASDYYPTEFDWYVVEYQVVGTEDWFAVCDTVYSEVFSNELCVWNTSGLVPGYYNIKICLCDNTPEQNKVEAVRQLILTDALVNADDLGNINLTVFPNPVISGQEITLLFNDHEIDFIEVFDLTGEKILDYSDVESSVGTGFIINLPGSGIYFLKFYDSKSGIIQTRKILVN
ncbi:MAG TPA: T9SS type A sorting domain-containing protein [Bacteroidales bacterium]|nr:T9SS type A sorting domain-containing protein [Bacteroidales bacterium]